MAESLHIAVIVDGNRRFAKKHNLSQSKGHEVGFENLQRIIKSSKELDIAEFTAYALSVQNLERTPKELEALFLIFERAMRKILDEEKNHEKTRVRFIGNRTLLPKKLQELMDEIETKTKANQAFTLNIALAYGGREEITSAVRQIAKEVKSGKIEPDKITQKTIAEHLWLQSEPDLIIRTGGDIRTSNYLPWQSVYSEWFFIDKLWPEFTSQDLKAILEEFSIRQRRFGK